jgi:hypothetical protein
MAQGQIDQILSSKPEERRAVFEEAAGITKYKSQRREALQKLALTDQNLARVADVIGEVAGRLAAAPPGLEGAALQAAQSPAAPPGARLEGISMRS